MKGAGGASDEFLPLDLFAGFFGGGFGGRIKMSADTKWLGSCEQCREVGEGEG